jgi:hypothetical protein
VAKPARTIFEAPALAFVLDCLREFPGAGYRRVKAAARTASVGAPASVMYGEALRVLEIGRNGRHPALHRLRFAKRLDGQSPTARVAIRRRSRMISGGVASASGPIPMETCFVRAIPVRAVESTPAR